VFRSFFTTIFRGSSAVLCAVTIPDADLRSLSLYYYAVCGSMCMSSVRVWYSSLLVICLWTVKQSTSRSPTDKNTKHEQMIYTCGHMLCNNTCSWWTLCRHTVPDNVHQLHVQQPSTYEKPEAASVVLGS
jgi:hypothetical protein